MEDASKLDFNDPGYRAKMQSWTGPINEAGAIERDAAAYVAFLDAQKEVDTAKEDRHPGLLHGRPAGVQDRGRDVQSGRRGRHIPWRRTGHRQARQPASADPQNQGAHVSRHRRQRRHPQPDAKDKLKAAFAAAHVPGDVEVYTGMIHGWCVRDMPMQDGKPIYNKPEAERAWGHLESLYKTNLA